jgi:translocation and assembly module TamB
VGAPALSQSADECPDAAPDAPRDAGFLVGLIEDILSTDSQSVKVTGLTGALSGRATLDELQLSDPTGPWLILRGAVLDWNRLALVRGRFSVNELSAKDLVILRKPVFDAPPKNLSDRTPETRAPFGMPELPVAIDIQKFALTRVQLAAGVAGPAANLRVTGDVLLADGALRARLDGDRLDRASDQLGILITGDNKSRDISIDVLLKERSGGLVGHLLALPEQPELSLTLKGTGKYDNLITRLSLVTDGATRLSGQVRLSNANPDTTPGTTPDRDRTPQPAEPQSPGISPNMARQTWFSADLTGDLRSLLADPYDPFFGPQTTLALRGNMADTGDITVSKLDLTAQSLALNGQFKIKDGRVDLARFDARVGDPDGPVNVLPIAGAAHKVQHITITLRLDGADNSWALGSTILNAHAPQFDVENARLVAGGVLNQEGVSYVTGDVDLDVRGLMMSDPAQALALGSVLQLNGAVDWRANRSLDINSFRLAAAGLQATGDLKMMGPSQNGRIVTSAEVRARNLAQFSQLAGKDLSGLATVNTSGWFEALTGGFDLTLDAELQDVSAGIAQLDPLIAGKTRLTAAANRSGDGISLTQLSLTSSAVSAEATGQMRSGGGRMTVKAGLDDLGRITPNFSGPVSANADLTLRNHTWNIAAEIDAPYGALATVDGQLNAQTWIGHANLSANAGDLLADVDPALLPLSLNADFDLVDTLISGRATSMAGPLATVVIDGQYDMSSALGYGNLNGKVLAFGDLPPTLFPMVVSGSGQISAQNTTLGTAAGTDTETETETETGTGASIILTAADLARITLTAALQSDGSMSTQIDGTVTGLGGLVPTEKEQMIVPARMTAQASRDTGGKWVARAALSADQAAQLDLNLSLLENGPGTYELTGVVNPIDGLFPDGLAPITVTSTGQMSEQLRGDAIFALRSADGAAVLDATAQSQPVGSTQMGSIDITVDGSLGAVGTYLPALMVPVTVSGKANVQNGVSARLNSDTNPNVDETADITANGDLSLNSGEFGQFQLLGGIDAAGLAHATLSGKVSSLGADHNASYLPLDVTGQAAQRAAGALAAHISLTGPDTTHFDAEARRKPNGDIFLGFDALFAKLGAILPSFPGQITARGRAQSTAGDWTLDSDVTGPADIKARTNATFVAATGQATLASSGNLQLAGLNPILSPNALDGPLAFDLTLNGKPGLGNLVGSLRVPSATFEMPAIGQSFSNISLAADFNQGVANIDLSALLDAGGSTRISGPVTILSPFDSDLKITLRDLVLTDNLSFQSGATGELTLTGSLARDPRLAGRVRLAPTSINLANLGGLVAAAPIPEITHVAESTKQLTTRTRAGLVQPDGDGAKPPNIGLDVEIIARDGMTVTGRGLNANLGGTILLDGTAANLQPSGAIELESGTFVIGGRPLKLTEGRISLQDSITPYISFAASSFNAEGSATIRVEGPLDQPEIQVFSIPDRSPEEALALLLFGNRQSQISPIKIAQIAAQLATGQSTLFGGQVATTEEGARNRLKNAGHNLYTDFTVNNEGQNEVTLSLDLSEKVTLRGSVENSGDTAIGMFYQRDY